LVGAQVAGELSHRAISIDGDDLTEPTRTDVDDLPGANVALVNNQHEWFASRDGAVQMIRRVSEPVKGWFVEQIPERTQSWPVGCHPSNEWTLQKAVDLNLVSVHVTIIAAARRRCRELPSTFISGVKHLPVEFKPGVRLASKEEVAPSCTRDAPGSPARHQLR